MAQRSNRNTGRRHLRGRENRRVTRDRKIFEFLRKKVAEAEYLHQVHGVALAPLSVFFGREELDLPIEWDLTPFPIPNQENGLPMPQWSDLSHWMKVAIAVLVGNEFDLLTFNIHLHPDLEREWVAAGVVRQKLAERVRKEITCEVGRGREFFFVIESISKLTRLPTVLHIHGAVVANEVQEEDGLEQALARAAGHGIKGSPKLPRAVHSEWFHTLSPAYPNYLFKFAKRFDPRLEERRLVMSQPLTSAARDLW